MPIYDKTPTGFSVSFGNTFIYIYGHKDSSFPKKYKITICGQDFRIRTDWYTDERKTQQFQKFLDTIKEKIGSPNIVVKQNGNQIYPR